MGWAFVQSKDAASNTPQFSSNTTTGNQIIVVVAGAASAVSISPGSGTFTRIVTNTANGFSAEIWECPNVTGGTTPTVTITGVTDSCTIYEFSGGNTSGTTDGTNTGTSAGTTALTTGSITTTVDGDLVFKCFGCSGTPNGTAETGWTEINPTLNGNVSGYIIQGTHGSITGTDTQSPSAAYSGVIAAFNPSSGVTVNLAASITARGAVTPRLGVPLIWDSGIVNWDDSIVAWDSGSPMTWDAPGAQWDDPLNVWDVGTVTWDTPYSSWDDVNMGWDAGWPITWDSQSTFWDSPTGVWDVGNLTWDNIHSTWDDPLIAWDASIITQWDSPITLWDSSIQNWDGLSPMSASISAHATETAALVALLKGTIVGTATISAKLYALLKDTISATGTVTPKLYALLNDAIAAKATVTPKLYALLSDSISGHASVTPKLYAILNTASPSIKGTASVTPKLYAILNINLLGHASVIAAISGGNVALASNVAAKGSLSGNLFLITGGPGRNHIYNTSMPEPFTLITGEPLTEEQICIIRKLLIPLIY